MCHSKFSASPTTRASTILCFTCAESNGGTPTDTCDHLISIRSIQWFAGCEDAFKRLLERASDLSVGAAVETARIDLTMVPAARDETTAGFATINKTSIISLWALLEAATETSHTFWLAEDLSRLRGKKDSAQKTLRDGCH